MRSRAWFIASVLLCTACTSQADFDSGVDDGVGFDEVTTAQAMTFCVAADAYLQTSFSPVVVGSFNCYVAALSSEVTPAACQAAYDACIAAPPSTPLDVRPIDCTFAGPEPTCHASVGELEHCLAAEVASFLVRIDEVSCSIAGNAAELMRLQGAPLTPEECTRLRTSCPVYSGGFFD
jgi:hypothetical protein